MPIQIWILLVPAAVLLLCGIYTRRRRRRWPSFSVGLILCDAFFLLCMLVVNMQISFSVQNADLQPANSVFPVPIGKIAGAVVRDPSRADSCARAYSWLQVLVVLFLAATVVSMVWECYRIFSVPPELRAAQKKLSEQEERLRHRHTAHSVPRSKERKSELHERKNKL